MSNTNALFRGLMEQLPPDGEVLSEERQADFLELFRLLMKLSYRSEEKEEEPPPPSPKQLPAPQEEPDVVELKARPAGFKNKLAARKKKPAKKAKPKDNAAIAFSPDGPSNGKLTAKAVILKILAASAAPMSAKGIVQAAEDDDDLDLSGFHNLKAAVAAQLGRLDQAGEIRMTDLVGNAKLYTVADREKF